MWTVRGLGNPEPKLALEGTRGRRAAAAMEKSRGGEVAGGRGLPQRPEGGREAALRTEYSSGLGNCSQSLILQPFQGLPPALILWTRTLSWTLYSPAQVTKVKSWDLNSDVPRSPTCMPLASGKAEAFQRLDAHTLSCPAWQNSGCILPFRPRKSHSPCKTNSQLLHSICFSPILCLTLP